MYESFWVGAWFAGSVASESLANSRQMFRSVWKRKEKRFIYFPITNHYKYRKRIAYAEKRARAAIHRASERAHARVVRGETV